jgi:hypothetical protein
LWPIDVIKSPDDYRGQLIRLAGRVTRVTPRNPDAILARRLEMPQYFECDVTLEKDGGQARILTTRVPAAWRQATQLDEPMSAIGLYVSRLGNGEPPPALWLAKEIAWHPGKLDQQDAEALGAPSDTISGKVPDRTFGWELLGNLGMDVGLLDQIQSRGVIRPEEREAFYQMLNAVGEIGASQLARFAQQNLPAVSEEWRQQLKAATNPEQQALAKEVLRKAATGSYSVVPLFNDAPNQIGRLFVFDGTARRVVRVEVGEGSAGGPSDIAERFGIDHYYEMDVFTEDSQNYALVFCFRELPDGFPQGNGLHAPVRVAGFFFKDWRFRARGSNNDEGRNESKSDAADIDPARVAPLLIGRAPLVLQPEQGSSSLSRYVGAGLFLLALGGIWAAALAYARSDRRFRANTPTVDFSLPAGQSLNDLDLRTTELPANSAGPSVFATGDDR